MPKTLTEAQVRKYHRDGYVFPMRALTEAEAAEALRHVEDFERDQGLEAQAKLVFKAHLPFRWLSDLIRHPGILDAVEDVLGPNILCWGTSFFQKNAHDSRFVSWHQDSYYYGLDPSDTLTAWVALTPSNLESGCVRVLPGTQNGHRYVDFANEPDENNLLPRGQTIKGLDLSGAVPMVLRPGEFSMHHEALIHGSDPNRSDHRRVGISIHYIAPHVKRVKYNKDGVRPRAALVRGVDDHGHWEHEPRTAAEFDPAALASLDAMRAEFFSRNNEGAFFDKPVQH